LEETIVLEWLQGFLVTIGISESAADVLCVLRERSGLIIGPSIYNFVHKSIAEFLVAEIVWDGDQNDLAGQRIDRMYLFEQRDNDRWNSVIFLWAGLSSVVDLVTFIDLCLAVKNWALAYGILYDQFDRISDREIRRRLLMPDLLNQQDNALFGQTNYNIIFGLEGSPSSGKKYLYEVSTIRLRGIGGHTLYNHLISLAIETNTLTFEDRLAAKAIELMNHIWFISPEYIQDIDNLRKIVSARPRLCQTDEEWYIFILHDLLIRTLYLHRDIGSTIELCHEILPEYSGLLPLLLLSICSYDIESRTDIEYLSWIKTVLVVLPDCSKNKSNPVWLLGTSNWAFRFPDREGVDLLIFFKERIEKLAQEGAIPHNDAFDRSVLYMNTLYEQRTVLAAQMGVELELNSRQIKRRLRRDVRKYNQS